MMRNRSFNAGTSLGFVKGPLGYVLRVTSHHVPSGSVSPNNVGTFHAIFLDVCLSDTKLNTLLPDNLGKVTSSPATTSLAKCVSWDAYFVVPVYIEVLVK